jgi:hypothetical protein
VLNVAHLLHWSIIIFQYRPQAQWCICPTLPSDAVEIWLLHPQPFTNSHFHFFIIVQSVTSKVLLQRPKQMKVCGDNVRTKGLQDYSILLTDCLFKPFFAYYPHQVLSSTIKQNASLTQKLQAKEPYLLNTLHTSSSSCHVLDNGSIVCSVVQHLQSI